MRQIGPELGRAGSNRGRAMGRIEPERDQAYRSRGRAVGGGWRGNLGERRGVCFTPWRRKAEERRNQIT